MLDPLFTLATQNQRLTENTQRSSDAPRTQALKETKEKGRKHHIDSADLEADLDEMSGDLLGDMDPDMFGHSGSASLFKQMWEDDVEGDESNMPQPEASDTIFDDGQSTRLIAAGPVNEAAEPKSALEELLAANSQLAEAAAEPAETQIGDDEESEAQTGPEPEPENTADPKPAPNDAASSRSTRHEVVKLSLDSSPALKFSAPEEDTRDLRREKLSLSQSEAAAKETSSAVSEVSWGVSSLLGNSEGFLLHESLLEIEVQSSTKERKPAEEAAVVVPKEMEPVLSALMEGDSCSPAWEKLRAILSRFGAGVLAGCVAQHAKVCLVPRGQLRNYPALRNLDGAHSLAKTGAAYVSETHTCLVAEEVFDGAPLGFHPALYYFAHAWDHALGGDEFASLHSPAVRASYEACRTKMDGHMFADSMAQESPVHYFAQSVEAYLSENDCRSPLWSRDDLYDFDSSMYSYIEYLFLQANKPEK